MKIPIPRPAVSKNVSGIEIRRISTKIVASEPSAIRTRLSGTVAGSSIPASRSASRIERREAEEEDELAERARVPAGHGERQAVGLAARVPAGEGGDREHEPGDPREPLAPVAGRPQARGVGRARTASGRWRRRWARAFAWIAVWGNSGYGVRGPPPRGPGVSWKTGVRSSRSSGRLRRVRGDRCSTRAGEFHCAECGYGIARSADAAAVPDVPGDGLGAGAGRELAGHLQSLQPEERWISCHASTTNASASEISTAMSDVEAVVSQTALLPRPHARVPAGAVVAVAQLDRRRVDRCVVVVRRGRCHRRSQNAYFPRVVASVDPSLPVLPLEALSALAAAALEAAEQPTAAAALAGLADAARDATGADLALARVADGDMLEAVAVAGPRGARRRARRDALARRRAAGGRDDRARRLPRRASGAGRRGRRAAVLIVPVRARGSPRSLELYRAGPAVLGGRARASRGSPRGQAALVLRALRLPAAHRRARRAGARARRRGARRRARRGAHGRRGRARRRDGRRRAGRPRSGSWRAAASSSSTARTASTPTPTSTRARELAAAALASRAASSRSPRSGCPAAAASRRRCRSASRRSALLQLLFARGRRARRGAARAARRRSASAPRTRCAPSARARTLELELERTRALLAVVGQATAQLSLAHTLETAVERVAELFGVERVAIYLRATTTASSPPAGAGSPGRTRASPSGCSRWRSARAAAAVVEIADAGRDERLRECATPRARRGSTRRSPCRCSCATR